MRRRNNSYLEQLQRRQEAAKSTEAVEPKATQPEALLADPTIRSELLADELRDARQELAQEKAARRQAERRLEAIETPAAGSLADLLRQLQAGRKRATWR